MQALSRLMVMVPTILVVGLPASAWGASPGPSVTPSGSTPRTVPFVAGELQGQWVGDPRSVEGVALDGSFTLFTLSDFTFRLEEIGDVDSEAYLLSAASTPAPGRLRLLSLRQSDDCDVGAEGLYDWTLSQGGTRLKLVPVSDPCDRRSAVLSGDWTRSSCSLPGQNCMGALEAGRYTSGWFDPRSPGGDAWRARAGALAYEVPDGWASMADWPMAYMLTPAADYEKLRGDPATPADMVGLWARPAALLVSCTPVADTAVGTSVDELVAWLSNHPGLVVSEPVPVTIDGQPGQLLDIDMAPGWAGTCDDPGIRGPFVSLLADAAGFDASGAWHDTSWTWGLGGTGELSDPVRVILLDLAGQALAITVDSTTAAGRDALVERAMPVVERFSFPR